MGNPVLHDPTLLSGYWLAKPSDARALCGGPLPCAGAACVLFARSLTHPIRPRCQHQREQHPLEVISVGAALRFPPPQNAWVVAGA